MSSYLESALDSSYRVGNLMKNIGSHAMLVTGIDNMFNIDVSSWGLKVKYMIENLMVNSGSASVVNILFHIK